MPARRDVPVGGAGIGQAEHSAGETVGREQIRQRPGRGIHIRAGLQIGCRRIGSLEPFQLQRNSELIHISQVHVIGIRADERQFRVVIAITAAAVSTARRRAGSNPIAENKGVVVDEINGA